MPRIKNIVYMVFNIAYICCSYYPTLFLFDLNYNYECSSSIIFQKKNHIIYANYKQKTQIDNFSKKFKLYLYL